MYTRVYAPDGEPFDVPRERADFLILQQGWTQTPPSLDEPQQESFPQEKISRTRSYSRAKNMRNPNKVTLNWRR